VHLKAQIMRELDRLEVVLKQLKSVEAERDALLKPESDEAASPAAMLAQLKGIGPETAAVLWSEGLYRQFDNRRQVAAYAGLAPTPWQSGSINHEQGVSKAGNPRLRTTMVELAWLWLQNQPTSALSLWFHERVRLGGRMRKTIIVALARKLLIALWRYCEHAHVRQPVMPHHNFGSAAIDVGREPVQPRQCAQPWPKHAVFSAETSACTFAWATCVNTPRDCVAPGGAPSDVLALVSSSVLACVDTSLETPPGGPLLGLLACVGACALWATPGTAEAAGAPAAACAAGDLTLIISAVLGGPPGAAAGCAVAMMTRRMTPSVPCRST
jgi:hypothetical protein